MAMFGQMGISLKSNKIWQDKIKKMMDSKRISNDNGDEYFEFKKINEIWSIGAFIEEETYWKNGEVYISLKWKWHIPTYLIYEILKLGFKDFKWDFSYEMGYCWTFKIKNGEFEEVYRKTIEIPVN